MNIAILCHGAVLQAAMEALASQGLLAGVAVPELVDPADPNLPLEGTIRRAGIPFLRVHAGELSGQLAPWLREIAADVVCCMGFPRRIPEGLLGLPRLGFFNLHGAELPAYRGPDPVFWQIRNRESHGAITIHRMTPELDAGGIALLERVPLGGDDTHALHMQRLGSVLPRVLIEFVQQLAIHGERIPLREQEAGEARWLPRPGDADRTIDWSRSVKEIDALVRACNPLYGGAHALLKGVPVRVLEVSEAPALPEAPAPGTIVSVEASGLRVACGGGESLHLGIVFGMDGFFTGLRLARIFGVRSGDRMG